MPFLFRLLLASCLLIVRPAFAQTPTTLPQQVFVTRNIDAAGQDRLIFIDLFTGSEQAVVVNGERYTAVAGGVLFYDRDAGRVKFAQPDGTVRDHPFMQPGENARRIDWVVSPDGKLLAWTITEGQPSTLITTTYVAGIDGANPRTLLVDGPRDGIRAMPVAFSPDDESLYLDYQPDSIGDLTPYRQYAGLFAVDLESGETSMLPGEPGCFCGAGLGAGKFLRLALTDDLSGFNLRIFDLDAGTGTTISALSLVGFTQAGDVLISPDGTRAVYALAQVRGFGTAQQSVRAVFVLADLVRQTQTALTDPVTMFLRPVAWTEDNSAVLLTSPTQDGTWKITLSDGTLAQVAAATYVGMVE